jgi:hypothetical protein
MMTCESVISLETGTGLLQAANEAAAEKTHTSPVTNRINLPRFPLSDR